MDVKSQLKWNILQTDEMDSTQYIFRSIDCSGNNCTAGLTTVKRGTSKWIAIFYQSTDGGETWFSQSPDIEFPGDFPNKGFIKIQRIDSLNIVAINEKFVIRTFDAGNTWTKTDNPSQNPLMDVHFSDPLTGILAAGDSIYLTSDGGDHWEAPSFKSTYLWICHSYGNGKYRLIRTHTGEVFTTLDNFLSVDSTTSIFDSLLDKHWNGKIIAGCTFGNGDTILAYGTAAREGIDYDTLPGHNLMIRTTNGGKQWEKPYIIFSGILGGMMYTTPITRDTVIATGQSRNRIFQSFDRGATWKMDSLPLDTAYFAFHPQGLAMTGDGSLLGSFTFSPWRPGPSIFVRGKWLQNSGVYQLIAYKTRVFPNPATTSVSIVSPLVSSPVYMYDIMGREIMRSRLSDEGKLDVDLTNIPNGTYPVSLDYAGRKILVDKIVVWK